MKIRKPIKRTFLKCPYLVSSFDMASLSPPAVVDGDSAALALSCFLTAGRLPVAAAEGENDVDDD